MSQPPPPQPPPPGQAGWSQPQPAAQAGGWQPQPAGAHPGLAQQPDASGRPRRRANVLGIAAILVAAVLTLSGPAQHLTFNLAVLSGGTASIAGINGLFTAIHVILALAAIGLGVAGLLVRDRGRILAAAAVGIGASTLVGVLASLVIGLAFSAR
ncbi:hypothetical protein GCM10009846_17500 [Agrococcus versicolor]|uniref:DUF4064 domain-containing protein n=1 Tax=Agrococcus versicolor TaxID=501482 RepID=A0ABP5MGZ8_9MICO